MLKIYAHSKASYAARTRHNAEVSDLTAAFALDFTTSGELMTKRAAGDKLVEIPLTLEWIEAARVLWKKRLVDACVTRLVPRPDQRLRLHGCGKSGRALVHHEDRLGRTDRRRHRRLSRSRRPSDPGNRDTASRVPATRRAGQRPPPYRGDDPRPDWPRRCHAGGPSLGWATVTSRLLR
jgi:hypothetical protein